MGQSGQLVTGPRPARTDPGADAPIPGLPARQLDAWFPAPGLSRSCAEPGAAGVLRRLIAGGPFSPADLVQIVGTGWCPRRFPTQSAALGWALHHLLAPEQRVVLGEMFETARARLDCEPGPLRLETAEALVRTWRLLAQRRAEEWHRPRRYRRRRDGHSELLVPDPSRVRR